MAKKKKKGQQHAIQVLNFLAERGYKVLRAKAQMVKTTVTYLGVQITPGLGGCHLIGYKESSSCPPPGLKNNVSFPGTNWIL